MLVEGGTILEICADMKWENVCRYLLKLGADHARITAEYARIWIQPIVKEMQVMKTEQIKKALIPNSGSDSEQNPFPHLSKDLIENVLKEYL